MSATCWAAWSGWSGSIRPASSLLRVISEREWPSRSCRSRASRSRSSLAASWATVARASRSSTWYGPVAVRRSSRSRRAGPGGGGRAGLARPPVAAKRDGRHQCGRPRDRPARPAAAAARHPQVTDTYTNRTSHAEPSERVRTRRAGREEPGCRPPWRERLAAVVPEDQDQVAATKTARPSQPDASDAGAVVRRRGGRPTGELRKTSQMPIHSDLHHRPARTVRRRPARSMPASTSPRFTPSACPSGTARPRRPRRAAK